MSIYHFDKPRLAYTQPAAWHQILYHRFPAVISLNGKSYEREADGLAIVPPRTVFSLERPGPPGTIFQFYFQPHPEAAYPLMFPPVFEAGTHAETLDLWMRRALDRLMHQRSFIQSILWTTLCWFGQLPSEAEQPSIVQQLELYVDEHLDQPFSMVELAEQNGISHNTLIRIAREHWGVPPLEYVRTRRLSRAAELLVSSPMPIKEVAVAVGIPDLHRFNKLVRQAFQMSPRRLREQRFELGVNEDLWRRANNR
jgi:AraC-like DNA-binding protein